MRILILGGDGYLGWPTAMHLSANGHEVAVVDNYFKRKITLEENAQPLVELPNLHERVGIWEAVSGYRVRVFICDLTEQEQINQVFKLFTPDAVVHYAEQPSAPYSMKDRHTGLLTLQNNLMTTANLIFAVREFCPECHIVKLGSMGEYGTPDIDVEEGWLDVCHNGREHTYIFPREPGSLYHLTKVSDTDLLWLYVRTWGLRVTDLMQGVVYGIFTHENEDDKLLSAFHYDEMFGTVINRFVTQAVVRHPLTVYGGGGQTRGFLNIKDTMKCVRLAIETPAAAGELRIMHQFTEIFSINQLAAMVCRVGMSMGLNTSIGSIKNPRVEKEKHYYNPTYAKLLDLGLDPHPLTDDVLREMIEYVRQHRDRINRDRIIRQIKWRKENVVEEKDRH